MLSKSHETIPLMKRDRGTFYIQKSYMKTMIFKKTDKIKKDVESASGTKKQFS
jgi:hypothetical protein